jgi:predicted signal transduction protein with EAL and GGDEF domain
MVEIGASIGVAIYPRDGETPEALLHATDTALYRVTGAVRRAAAAAP